MAAAQRPWTSVPRPLCWLLAACLLLQLGWRLAQQHTPAQARPLPAAPPASVARLVSLGEPLAMSKAMLLYLQSFEDQPGVILPWRELDYDRLAGWLETAQTLDPRSRYALVPPAKCTDVADPQRARRMLAFVAASFAADPRSAARHGAGGAGAKHQLHDLPLALSYARALRQLTTGSHVPPWVREMEAFLLEDMDQLDAPACDRRPDRQRPDQRSARARFPRAQARGPGQTEKGGAMNGHPKCPARAALLQ